MVGSSLQLVGRSDLINKTPLPDPTIGNLINPYRYLNAERQTRKSIHVSDGFHQASSNAAISFTFSGWAAATFFFSWGSPVI